MRKKPVASIVLLTGLLISTWAIAQPPPLIFEHANVLTMTTASPIKDAVVVTRGGNISYVGPARTTPAWANTARRIDLRGAYLLPGLSDMHAHLGYTEAESDQAARDELFVYLANGVTTIRNMSGSAWYLIMRKRLSEGEVLGPRMFTTGPILESRRSHAGEQPPRFKPVPTSEEARLEVHAEKAAGYDFVKIYNQIDQSTYDTIVQTAREVRLPVTGHVAIEPGLAAAFRNKQASIEHYRGYDLELSSDPKSTRNEIRFAGWRTASDERLRELARLSLAADAWNVPTFVSLQMSNDTPKNRAIGADYPYLPAHMFRSMNSYYLHNVFSPEVLQVYVAGIPRQYAFTKFLNEAGAHVMTGTDAAAPGIGLHREIENFHAAGLSRYDALRAATSTPGAWFERYVPGSGRAGVVEVGARADLLILAEDPLVDLRALETIEGVVIAGRYLSGDEIKQRLEELRRRNAPQISKIRAALQVSSPSTAAPSRSPR